MKTVMKGMMMKGVIKGVIKGVVKGLVFAATLVTNLCVAQQDIDGVWAGRLEVAPGNAMDVHFTLAQDAAGAWTAIVNSPETGAIKDVAASSVSFDGTTLNIDVAALSGSYTGTLANGTFTGEWTQPGGKLPMNLAPYVASVLSDEAMALLLGQWHGKAQLPGVSIDIIFNFERNEAGEFVGNTQQGDTSSPKVALADISFENNELFFRVPQARAEYRATLVNGAFNGGLKQGPQDIPLNIVKGEFVAEKITLALTDADYEKLAGEWSGTLAPPGAPSALTLVMSFTRDASGAIVGTFRSPQQGNTQLKITTATLTGTTLAVELKLPPAKFSGELDGTSITGNWTQGPGTLPLTLTKQ